MESKLKMVLVNPVTPGKSTNCHCILNFDFKSINILFLPSDVTWIELMKFKNIETHYKSNDLPIDSQEWSDARLTDHIYPERTPYAAYSNLFDKQLSGALDDRAYGYPVYSNIGSFQPYDNDLVADESKVSIVREAPCELSININTCPENEACMQLDAKSSVGVCHCNIGFVRNALQKCVPPESNFNYPDFNDKMMLIKNALTAQNREDPVDDIKSESAEIDPKMNHLSVSVVSKTVQLPDSTATLSAFPVPDEQTSGVSYNYSWSLISQPSGDVNGTTSDKTKSEIELTNLSEGLYRFKVVVSGKGWKGETYANITVLPLRRVNKAPNVIIKPAQQIIKAPTNSAILDGSASTVWIYQYILSL